MLKSYGKKWASIKPIVVDPRIKRIIVKGRLVELKKIDSHVLQNGTENKGT